ncbi:MAG: NAD-dependent epimerase/dehydratase family protein [Polyangiales bacterium]
MSAALAWVVGRSGLLGSHLEAALRVAGHEVWTEAPQFLWASPDDVARQFETALSDFSERAKTRTGWMIFWAAGAGVIGTTADQFQQERRTFRDFLELLERTPEGPGVIFFASSAGGVYAGCQDGVVTESSPCKPISLYGENKVAQEDMLVRFARAKGLPCLVGRIANIYGPGQNMAKPQGLISQLVRSVIHNTPFHVYVPLDTIRDFLFVADCARSIVDATNLVRERPCTDVTKIFASGESTPLSKVIRTVAMVARRQPKIVSACDTRRKLQPHTLLFQSLALPDLPQLPRTGILVGIAQVYHYQLEQYCAGRPLRATP